MDWFKILILSVIISSRLPILSIAAPIPVMNPQLASFWNMDEAKKVLLDVQIVKSGTEDGFLVKGLYYTSEMTPNGPNRIYCGYAYPVDTTKPKPVLVIIHGGGGHGSTETALYYAKRLNVPVLSLDWAGAPVDDTASTTTYLTQWRYPKLGEGTLFGKGSNTYHIIIAIRRGLDFLSLQPNIDTSRIVLYGGSWGSYYAHLVTGIDSRVTDLIGHSGAGGWSNSYSICAYNIHTFSLKDKSEFLSTMDPISVAPYTVANITMLAPTNDDFFWYEGLQRHFLAYKNAREKRLILQPNSNHGVGGYPNPVGNEFFTLLKYHLQGTPVFPKIVSGSLHFKNNRFLWKSTGENTTSQKAYLYWSPGKNIPYRSRYWVQIPAHRDGMDWIAFLPISYRGLECEVFATVIEDDDKADSTPTQSMPGTIDPRTQASLLWKNNKFWDEQAGIMAWRPTSTYNANVIIKCPSPDVIHIQPTNDVKKFSVLTNSILLASGCANQYTGIQLVVDGKGENGVLSFQLCRDIGKRDLIRYTTEVPYSIGKTTIKIPWKKFIPSTKGFQDNLCPFETLILEGQSFSGNGIQVENLALYKE